MSFGTIGMYAIFLKKDYISGRRWAEISRAIISHQSIKNGQVSSFPKRCYILLYITIDIFFDTPQNIAKKLFIYHKDALRAGHMDYATFSLNIGLRFQLFGGENLSMLSKSFDEHIRFIVSDILLAV